MKLEDALELWRGSGYRAINGLLLKEKASEAAAKKYLGTTTVTEETKEAIRALRAGMTDVDTSVLYYRGASKLFEKNCHLETFVSVSKNKEDAQSFVDKNGKLYTITLAKGVRGIPTGVEGEVLLEDGCFWEYTPPSGATVHPPRADKGYPLCSTSLPACPVVQKPKPCAEEFELTEEEKKELEALGIELGGKRWKMPRKMSRKYCKKTPCKKMGFTQRSSCRPYKNCFTRRARKST